MEDLTLEIHEDIEPVCNACPEIANNTKVVLSHNAEVQINTLLREYSDSEWIALLVGRKYEGYYYITELAVGEQENSSVTTEFTEKGAEEVAKVKDVIGWIHSHNTMSAFQSCTDEKTGNAYDVSITVNNKKEYFVRVRKKLSCGRFGLAKTDILREAETTADTQFLEKVKDLIKHKVSVVSDYNLGFRSGIQNGQTTFEDEDKRCSTCLNQLPKRIAKRAKCTFCGRQCHKECVTENGLCEPCWQEDTQEYPPYKGTLNYWG